MRTRTGPMSRARASGIDAVRGALFGANNNSRAANDNNSIGGARRGGRLGSTSDSA